MSGFHADSKDGRRPTPSPRLLTDQRGLSSLEYSVLFVVVCVAAVVTWRSLGRQLVCAVRGGQARMISELGGIADGAPESCWGSSSAQVTASSAVREQDAEQPVVGVTVAVSERPLARQPQQHSHPSASPPPHAAVGNQPPPPSPPPARDPRYPPDFIGPPMPVVTGLGGDVDRLVAKRPALTAHVAELQSKGWRIEYPARGANSGYCDRDESLGRRAPNAIAIIMANTTEKIGRRTIPICGRGNGRRRRKSRDGLHPRKDRASC